MNALTFAAARGARLDAADKEIRPLIAKALDAFDETGWADIADAAAVLWLELFEKGAPEAYQDAALAGFRKSILKALEKTSAPSDPPTDGEIDRVTNWVSSYTSNNATYQGAYASGFRQKQWVSRHDDKVRHSHQRIDGQKVSISGTFDVDGNKLRYPGEPVGPPEVWINCRCLVMGVGKKMTMGKLTAAAADVDTSRTAVVVALPHPDHPVNGVSNEEDGAHMTLAFLGDPDTFDLDAVKQEVAQFAASNQPFTDKVSGRGTLGPNEADVQLMNGEGSVPMRNKLLHNEPGDSDTLDALGAPPVRAAHDAVEQHPTFIPHITLGYPEAPASGDPDYGDIQFDRLAVWAGNDDHTEYPLGQSVDAPAEEVTAAADVVEAEPVVDEEPDDDSDFVDADLPVPFHGVAAPVGVMSGDGRKFSGTVTWRQLPLPFKYQPMTAEGHDYAVSVGRIDNIWVDPADNLIKYEGVFNSTKDAQTVIEGIVFGDIRSVSVDLGGATVDPTETGEFNGNPVWAFSEIEIAAITAVSVGAFSQANVALGTWADDCGCDDEAEDLHPEEGGEDLPTDDEMTDADFAAELAEMLEQLGFEVLMADGTFAPGTHDGPGWITNPTATERIRNYWVHGKGAAKIRWGIPGDFNRCRKQLSKYVQNPDWLAGLCANMHKEAIGVWPGQEAGTSLAAAGSEVEMAPAVTFLEAAGGVQKPHEWFSNPNLTKPTQLTITPEGRVYGHLAVWGVCHIGMQGVCTTAPHSATNYAYFHTGQVRTDQGFASVGHFTRGIGHAGGGITMAQATAHYDDTGATWADVAVGEDGIGIWYSGSVRDGFSEEVLDEIRADGAISGDWRGPSKDRLELVAAVIVGTPGYPIPREAIAASGGMQTMLVAAGIVTHETEVEPEVETPETPLDVQLAIVRAAANEAVAEIDRRARVAAARKAERAERLSKVAALREKVDA